MKDAALLMDLYELTMAEAYWRHRQGAWATFDLFVRQLPKRRSYLVAAGLEDVLEYIRALKFTPEDIAYLRDKKIFSSGFLKYLGSFRFRGDIWAIPEGTVVFANEPLLRVTAPIIEAQVIESFLLNTINLQTMIASKASRVVNAARGREVFDFSLRRTHGAEAGLKVARSSYIAGCSGTSTVLASRLYGIPGVGTMAHSFVMSFKDELEGFLAYALTFPKRCILLVDTYNTASGVKNAVTVGGYLKKQGFRLSGIRLDSGDFVSLSKMSRRELDKGGLKFTRIFASGNLDEFKIKEMLERGASIDSFGVGTNMGASTDASSLDVIYKIVEIGGKEGEFLPRMKLSEGKVTYPGRKQVYRLRDKSGRFKGDTLGLEKEKIKGEPLLIKVADKGRIIYRNPGLKEIRARLKRQLQLMPAGVLRISPDYRYPVRVSKGLGNLCRSLEAELREKSGGR